MESNFDKRNGYNSVTKTFHSLRPPLNLPPEETPLSAAEYALSLQSNSPWPDSVAFIDASTSQRVSYSEFSRRVDSLSYYLRSSFKLSKGQVAMVLTPNSVRVPIIYFALLSLGVVITPFNPVSTESEISKLIKLSNPVIAIATSSTTHKTPKLELGTILIDSPEFDSMMTLTCPDSVPPRVEVSQTDLAAILYSSGTTGNVKGVMLTHRNFIATIASFYTNRELGRESPEVQIFTVPYFHVFGFTNCLRSVAVNETVVVMERFDLKNMLKAVEEFRVTHLIVAPPVVVALVKTDVTEDYDLRSFEDISSGGAALGKDVIAAFTPKFPGVSLTQGYGLTETTGPASRLQGPEEGLRWGSAGRIQGGCEAMIIDPDTLDALPPGKHGELWLRGQTIMKGYIGDSQATFATITSDGWLRTGDLGYIDEEGFVFIVDRLKELIKYKGYQVAPAELEQLLQSHPEITDAAVIPYPDEEAGQIPMAFIVRDSQSRLGVSEIIDFVAKQVAPYKKIRRLMFVNSIPKNASGKILRKELRKKIVSSKL